METKEIIEIIVGILASIGLLMCIVATTYCIIQCVVVDRQIKRDMKRIDDELAKLEKEE